MAWQNGYYYRKRRQGKRIISEYVGKDYAGLLAEMQDAHERQQREAERERFRALVEQENAVDKQIEAVAAKVDTLVTAVFLAAGYRQHRRQWRMKRNGKTKQK